MRIREALELSAPHALRACPPRTLADLDMIVDAGLVTITDGQAVLTPDGRLLANEVAIRLTVTEAVG